MNLILENHLPKSKMFKLYSADFKLSVMRE